MKPKYYHADAVTRIALYCFCEDVVLDEINKPIADYWYGLIPIKTICVGCKRGLA